MARFGVGPSLQRSDEAIKSIKDIPVVLGGPHVSVLPAESAQRPEVDVVVRGEGEEVWTKLCGIIENAKKIHPGFTAQELLDSESGHLDTLLGISYFTRAGQERHNPDHPPIADLDTLPFPAWDLLDGFPERYLPAPFKVRRYARRC